MRSPDTGLTPAERRRLVGSLNLLASDLPGERDAAGLAAVRLLRRCGLDWETLIGCPAPPPQQPDLQRSASAIIRDLDLAARHKPYLDAWQQEFVANLLNRVRARPLSPKQSEKLAQIAAELRARGFA